MNKETYEVLFIIPAKYAEDELQPIKQLVIDAIKKHDGEITKEDTLGKRKLAYPIKHIYHGYYFYYHFDIQPSQVPAVNQILRHTPELLRHIIVIPTPMDEKAQARLRASAQEETNLSNSEQRPEEIEEAPVKKERKPRKIQVEKEQVAPIKEEITETPAVEEKEIPQETVAPKKRAIKKKETEAPKKKEKKMTLEELDKSLDEILKDDII